jgi:SAM-dependent methyltransferase
VTTSRFVRLTPYQYPYLDYERELARREIAAITGRQIKDGRGDVALPPQTSLTSLTRLTYVQQVVPTTGKSIRTDQARLEASASASSSTAARMSMRQRTRYSAHGLHDYRGKFNPQIVRALGNIAGLGSRSRILDPFCGSGTTLLEALHSGWHAVGLDLNPLAIFVANAKIAAVRSEPLRLSNELETVAVELERTTKGLDGRAAWSDSVIVRRFGRRWADELLNIEYLERWFPRPVLAQYSAIFRLIRESVSPDLQSVFQVVASDLAREASLQDPGDLRIRRRKEPIPNAPLATEFVRTARERFAAIARARAELHINGSRQAALVADSRTIGPTSLKSKVPGFALADAVITSPPYLTALPYIDTQRLSLCLLGLVNPANLASVERSLTGAREIGASERASIEVQIREGAGMPAEVARVCARLLDRSRGPGNGFRRRNVPALAYRYFADMRDALTSVATIVKPKARCYAIVGPSATELGGKRVVIDTPVLLGAVAEATARWRVVERLELNAYQRYSMHKRNSIRRESLLILERS